MKRKNKKTKLIKMREKRKPFYKMKKFPLFVVVLLVVISFGVFNFVKTNNVIISKLDSKKFSAPTNLVSTWTASPVDMGNHNYTGTIRNIVYTDVAGKDVQVKFTNTFGDQTLEIRDAYIAVSDKMGNTLGEAVPLRYGGKTSFNIPKGKEFLSDVASITVPAQSHLSVSFFLPRAIEQTGHDIANETSFLKGIENQATSQNTLGWEPNTSWWFIDSVIVKPTKSIKGTVVTFGDSITDGFQSTIGGEARYSNVLATRLKNFSVVNAGIVGNKVLKNGSIEGNNGARHGNSALIRFNHNISDSSGAKYIILLEGVNDISLDNATAKEIINAYKKIISQAHQAGIKIYGGTLTPFKASANWSEEKEKTREKVNQWIVKSGAFDATIDFSSAIADPTNPQKIEKIYDSGDHLHPNDIGYKAMGDAVNLKLFK